MIYFHDELIEKTLKIIQMSNTYIDVLNDLIKIQKMWDNVCQNGISIDAVQLHISMKRKYPTIEKMLDVADKMPSRKLSTRSNEPYTPQNQMLNSLRQDYYGIIIDTGIKEKIKNTIEEFIREVTTSKK